VLTVSIVCLVFGAASCHRNDKSIKTTEEEPLLLLDEGGGGATAVAVEGADNSRCHVCHFNFSTEELAVKHARGGVGCEDCHGQSNAHCSDEDNITPPDVMFGRETIDTLCLKCHPDMLAGKKKREAAGPPDAGKVCTDCHDKHRMSHRTRRWNKETGELLSDDNVRMVEGDKGQDR
jgi:hypothetical protein